MEHRTSPTPTGADQQKNQANRLAVLVTGASGGIGRAISQAFGEIGWYVGVHYYQNESAAETTLGQVLKVGGTGSTYAADVREPESVRRMFDQFSRNTQGPIAVVCNAGIGQSELLVRHADHIWDNVLATNLTGTFHCLRACAPLLLDRGGGSIIVIGSHTGFHGARGQSAYATSKAGLIGLVKTAALEWGPQNIRVNLLLPGWQKTDLTEGVFPEGSGWLDHALRRPPASEEMARTVVHLAQLRDMSGQVWNCDSRYL
ncbi:MAG: SDR family oxidoreductase [Nitrospira sp.]|nr:SDR family oxidoreductase [Nitrospira sp.]